MNDDAQLALSLLAEHGPRLHGLLLRITLREDAAEDLLQELFLRLSQGGLRRAKDPMAYAVTAATRLAFDWRRSQRQRRDAGALVAEPAKDAAPVDLDRHTQLEGVLAAIEQLPRQQRDAVVLRYLQELPYEDVAATLGTSTHHARAICYRGIMRLRKLVQFRHPARTEDLALET